MDTIARTVRLAEWIWNALDRDADRCRRSSVKQLEAVLAAYYGHETQDVNLDRAKQIGSHEGLAIEDGGELGPHGKVRTLAKTSDTQATTERKKKSK